MTRNSYFDNLKSLLIFSVVIGHLLPSFKGDIDFLETSYLFIYLFHMPLFVLISGYFSKKYNSKGYINKLFVKLIIPYILFQVFYTAFYNYLGSNVEYNFATPRWALWFLVSLFSWNILLFIFAKLKYGIVIAFLISILAGYAPFISAEYSLSRTLFFFPFFLIGYHLKEAHFMYLKQKRIMFASSLLLILSLLLIHYLSLSELKFWLMGKRSYLELLPDTLEIAWIYRTIIYIFIGFISISVLSLIPKRKNYFTRFGEFTFFTFILHLIFVKIIIFSPAKDYIELHSQYWLLLVISFIICFITQHKFTRKLVGGFIEPNIILSHFKSFFHMKK